MSRLSRRTDPSKQVDRLEKRHQLLKEQVAEFEGRLSLTPQEQMALSKLKKEKLRTKDELTTMSG